LNTTLSRALADIADGIGAIHLWPTLGYQEIRQRYRRSVLGPFWLTISVGVLVAGMGPLYGRMFGQNMAAYLPHLAVSFITWMLIANLLNESCMAFIAAEGLIKQARMPLTVHVLSVVWRNLIIYLHHAVILLIVFVIYTPPLRWGLLLVPLGVLAIAVNAVWLGLFLGMLCARFRDFPLIIQSVVQVMFFLTPVLWKPEFLGRHAWAAHWNPLHHLLEIVRAPLIAGEVPAFSWLVVVAMALVGFAVVLPFFARYRARIAYWV